MTASDHLKQATGSLGGDQIPEDLKQIYKLQKAVKRSFRNDEDAVAIAERTIMLIERIAKAEAALAQKTRECEEKQHEIDLRVEQSAALNEDKERFKAKVEQLQRQVAEMKKPVTERRMVISTAQGDYDVVEIGGGKPNQFIKSFCTEAEAEEWIASRARTK